MHLLHHTAAADEVSGGAGAGAPPAGPPDEPTLTERSIALGDELSWEQLVEEARRRGPDPRFADLDDGQLTERLCLDAAAITAAMCAWLELLGEFVVRDVWVAEGMRTPGAWLAWKLGIAPPTAREHVRVALRLRDLPAVRARFAAGELSYSKVRAITRAAVAANEDTLLAWADHATAAQLDTIVRGLRRAQRARDVELPPDEDRRYRETVTDHGDGTTTLALRGPSEEVAAVRDGLRLLAETLVTDRLGGGASTSADDGRVADAGAADADAGAADADAEAADADAGAADADAEAADADGDHVPTGADGEGARDDLAVEGAPPRRVRAADLVEALGHVVAGAVAAEVPVDTSGLDRTTYVVQVDGADLATEPTDGPDIVPVRDTHGRVRAMDRRALHRLACEAGLVTAVHDEGGGPLDLGRRRRRTNAALRRAVHLRDRCCRFPGCGASRNLHVHHVVEWGEGGPTDLGNLVLLCAFHHRFVHDRDVSIEVDPAGRHRFTRAGQDQPLPRVGHLPGASAGALPARPERADPTALAPAGIVHTGRFDLDTAIAVLLQSYVRTGVETALAA